MGCLSSELTHKSMWVNITQALSKCNTSNWNNKGNNAKFSLSYFSSILFFSRQETPHSLHVYRPCCRFMAQFPTASMMSLFLIGPFMVHVYGGLSVLCDCLTGPKHARSFTSVVTRDCSPVINHDLIDKWFEAPEDSSHHITHRCHQSRYTFLRIAPSEMGNGLVHF